MTSSIIGKGHTLILGKAGQYQNHLALHLAAGHVKRGEHVIVLCHSEAEANEIRRILILAQRLEPSFETTRWHIVSGFTRYASAPLIEPLINRELVDSHIASALIFRDLSQELLPVQPDDAALQTQSELACYGQVLTAISICGPTSPLPDFKPYAEHADNVWICRDAGSELQLVSYKPLFGLEAIIRRFGKRTAGGVVILENQEFEENV